MSQEALVHAWLWGYDEGRREALEQCNCDVEVDAGNVIHLDARRRINECRSGTD